MIKANKLRKTYFPDTDHEIQALDGISFEIPEGEATVVVGPSGSGKSTILNILGGLDTHYQGEIEVNNIDIKNYNTNQYRRNVVGTIFQQFNLMPSLSVEENILLPLKFGKQFTNEEAKERAHDLLKRLGIGNRANHKPSELSGGQSQRVAIARALMVKPQILLADEPTGNLDSTTGEEIFELLQEINQEENVTLVVVTHDVALFDAIDNKIRLLDGKIVNN